MKGIVLAGGNGTRLHPLTLSVSKQLLPVYNKPMIYYPLSVLMLAGIREILLITTAEEQSLFKRLLGDGSQLGMAFSYAVQEKPRGLAEAFLIGKHFIANDPVCLILGDNIFYGNHLSNLLLEAKQKTEGATVFGYEVNHPERYGVVELDASGRPVSIEEKPQNPKSHIAVTGLYFYDNQVVSIAEQVKPSRRGELEITDINRAYLSQQNLSVKVMGRGFAWLDAGTYDSLMQAGQFVQVIEERQGHAIACLEEIAYHQKFIDQRQLETLLERCGRNSYGDHLKKLVSV